MQLKINKVDFHNFLSFEYGEVIFNNSGYTLIQGINNNVVDLATSNGSGKSSIFEAVSWALTGELIRGTKNVKRLNSNDKDVCSVSIYFDIDNIEYQIYRQSNPSKLEFKINGENKSGKGIRDTERIIQEHLPDLTSSLLGSVVILGQGLPQKFSNNTPSGRKEVLETLSKSDSMIYDLKDKVVKRSSKLFEKERFLDDDLLKTVTQKELFEKDLDSAQKEFDSLDEIEKLETTISLLKEKLKSNQDYYEYSNKLIVSLNEQRDKLSKDINDLHQQRNDEIEQETRYYDEKLSELAIKNVEYETLINTKQQEVERLKNIKNVCPTCGQKLPGVEKVDTSNLEAEIKSLKDNLSNIMKDVNKLSEEKNEVVLLVKDKFDSSIYNAETEIDRIVVKINDLKANLYICNEDINEINSDLVKCETQKLNRENIKLNIESKIKSLTESVTECTSKILYINNEKDELQKHIDIIQKMKTVVNRDFRGYLLSSVIDFINKKAKEYSQDIFETDRIDFILNGNNIDISYDDKEYGNLSGGERQKVDLIIQFAIRDMLCKYLDFSSNILVIDELFDNLDSIGCEKILNFITKKLNDIESVYIITHHSDIPIPFDNILTVTKGEDGISRIN